MILADTSVWVGHIHAPNYRLQELLLERQILMHPFVMGEIACGNLRNRERSLGLFHALPVAAVAAHQEVLRLVEERRLWGTGITWIDAHLLASALLSGCSLWTLDQRLQAAARRLKLEFH